MLLQPPSSNCSGSFSVCMFWVKLSLIYNVVSHEGSLMMITSLMFEAIHYFTRKLWLFPPQNKTNKNPRPTPREQMDKLTKKGLLHQSFCTCSHFVLSILINQILIKVRSYLLHSLLQPQSQHRAFNIQEHNQVFKSRLWFSRLSDDDLSNFLLTFF